MTKLYISADLEGICGITSPHQCYPSPDPAAYAWGVERFGKELNVVVQAAWAAGAKTIVINDSHGYMTNLKPEYFGGKVSLLSGKPKPLAMSAGLDDSFDGAFYIGYHAKAGTEKGVLCHTFHDKLFNVTVNGVSYGEAGINALHASLTHGVPLVFASGDAAFCAEVEDLVPKIETVTTKEGLGYAAALNYPEDEVFTDYWSKIKKVLGRTQDWGKNKLSLKGPYQLEVTLIHALAADTVMTMPRWTRLDGCTVAYTAETFREAYQALQSAYSILAYSAYLH